VCPSSATLPSSLCATMAVESLTMRTSESASSSCLSSSPPCPWPAPSFLGTNGRISFLKLTRMTCTQHKINATSAGERHRGIINGESRACTRRRGTWRSGTPLPSAVPTSSSQHRGYLSLLAAWSAAPPTRTAAAAPGARGPAASCSG
jgi:hypothetical protein